MMSGKTVFYGIQKAHRSLRFGWCGLWLLCLLLLSACEDSGRISGYGDGERLALRWGVSAQPTAALSIIALEKGYFAKAGLNMSSLRFPSGTRAMREGLFTNRVNATSPTEVPVVIAAFKRNDFVVLGTQLMTDNTNRIVARRDHGIETAADLKGKRIGTQRGSAVHYFLHLFLGAHGLSEQDVEIVFMKAEELPNALAKGDIDAFSMREPYVSLALSMLPDQAYAMAAPGLYKQMELLVMDRRLSEEEPEIALRMLRGLIMAEEYLAKNPDDAIVTTARYLGSPDDKVRDIWPKLQLQVSLDESLIKLMENQAQWAISAGLVEGKTPPDFRGIIKPEPLRSLQPQRVNVPW